MADPPYETEVVWTDVVETLVRSFDVVEVIPGETMVD
jgi:hypothetical protein